MAAARREVTPRYAALLWSFAVPFVGGWLCGLLVTAPYLLVRTLVFRVDSRFTSNLELRTLQMAQIPITYLLGGAFCAWYFRRTFAVDAAAARPWVMRYRWLPFLFVGLGSIGPAAANYGEAISRAWSTDHSLAIRGIEQMALTALMLVLWDALWALRMIPSWYDRYQRSLTGAPAAEAQA
jgi:hypothetical protein